MRRDARLFLGLLYQLDVDARRNLGEVLGACAPHDAHPPSESSRGETGRAPRKKGRPASGARGGTQGQPHGASNFPALSLGARRTALRHERLLVGQVVVAVVAVVRGRERLQLIAVNVIHLEAASAVDRSSERVRGRLGGDEVAEKPTRRSRAKTRGRSRGGRSRGGRQGRSGGGWWAIVRRRARQRRESRRVSSTSSPPHPWSRRSPWSG